MKRVFSLVLVLLFAASLVFAGGGRDQAAGADPVVRIGLFQALTGGSGPTGRMQNVGVYYAHSKQPYVDIGGVRHQVEFVTADNQSLTSAAPAAAQQLVASGVSFVLGSTGSGLSMAGSDTFGAARIAAIGMTNTNPNVTLGNDHYFRLVYLDPFQGTVLATHAWEALGARSAYVLTTMGDDYSMGLSNFFIESFRRRGGTIIQEFYPPGTSDFSSYIATARARDVNVFMVPTIVGDAQLIIDQIIMQGLTIPVLAGDTWDNPVIVDGARGRNLRLYVSTFYAEGANPEFDAGYRAFVNANPVHLASNGGTDRVAAATAIAYDAYNVALEAFRRAGSTNPARVLEALRGVQKQGVSGWIEFDRNGDRVMDFAYIKRLDSVPGLWVDARQVFVR